MSKKKPSKRSQALRRQEQKPKRQLRAKESVLGRLKGRIQIVGDIVSPITPLEDWEALKE